MTGKSLGLGRHWGERGSRGQAEGNFSLFMRWKVKFKIKVYFERKSLDGQDFLRNEEI